MVFLVVAYNFSFVKARKEQIIEEEKSEEPEMSMVIPSDSGPGEKSYHNLHVRLGVNANRYMGAFQECEGEFFLKKKIFPLFLGIYA